MISFIILNYKSFQDTVQCIHSIKKIKTDKKITIIIVDNNTLENKQFQELKKYTKDIVRLKDNMGYAKGNNEGCQYAIKKYQPDFLCVINSDTIIEQKTFIDNIYKLYAKYQFDILGPKILPENTDSCNPFKAYQTLEEVEERIKYTQKLIKIYKNRFLRFLLSIYLKIKSIFRKKIKNTNGNEDTINVALHGCALVFSKQYYQKFEDIFFKETFLFHEEEFLYLRSKRYHLTTLYSPSLEIIHKEGQSIIKKFNHNKYQSILFRNQEILKSLNLLKQEMLKDVKK